MFDIIALCFISFSGGIIIASAIYAFLTVIGLIPRFVIKTKTQRYYMLYENAVILSGTLSVIVFLFDLNIRLPFFIYVYCFFCIGIFIGSLAVSIAEVIDVMPIIIRTFKLDNYITYIILAIAFGKSIGAFLYYYFGYYISM